MTNVNFYLKDRKSKQSLIYAVFFYHGNRVKYSISQKVDPADWNFDKQRMKSRRGKERDAREFNLMLDNIENFILTTYRAYINDHRIVTIQEFKKELDVFLFKDQKKGKNDFISFIHAFVDERFNSKEHSYGTNKVLKTVANHMDGFAKYRGYFTFKDTDVKWKNELVAYLFEEKDLSVNYVHKILSAVKQFMYEAKERGLHNESGFMSRRFTISKMATDEVYISMEELQKIYHTNLPRGQEQIRDLFVIANFVGVRSGDWHKIRPDNFFTEDGIEMIRINTQKTKETVVIPINPALKKIIEKYDYRLPPIPVAQYFNRQIKEVCRKAGIDTMTWKTVSNGGDIKQVPIEKWKRVSTHTARRSFATNAYLAGISPVAISKLTGHKSVKQLLEYIKATPIETAISVADNEFFQGDGF